MLELLDCCVVGKRPYDFNDRDGRHVTGVTGYVTFPDSTTEGLSTGKLTIKPEISLGDVVACVRVGGKLYMVQ